MSLLNVLLPPNSVFFPPFCTLNPYIIFHPHAGFSSLMKRNIHSEYVRKMGKEKQMWVVGTFKPIHSLRITFDETSSYSVLVCVRVCLCGCGICVRVCRKSSILNSKLCLMPLSTYSSFFHYSYVFQKEDFWICVFSVEVLSNIYGLEMMWNEKKQPNAN